MITADLRKERARIAAMMSFERRARLAGFKRPAGVDEAGRGPLAGPVVAAACVLPEKTRLLGIDDSKKLSFSERARLFQKIISLPGHEKWPQYGFDQHKGYGTSRHLLAIAQHGPCPIHRLTFAPLKSFCYR